MRSAEKEGRRARDYDEREPKDNDREKSNWRSEEDRYRDREKERERERESGRSEDRYRDSHDSRHRDREKKHHERDGRSERERDGRSERERDGGDEDRRRDKYRSSEREDKASRSGKDERIRGEKDGEMRSDRRRFRDSVDRERSVGRDGSVERREKHRVAEDEEGVKERDSRSGKDGRRHRDKDGENQRRHRHRTKESVDRERSVDTDRETSVDRGKKHHDVDGVSQDRAARSARDHSDREEDNRSDRHWKNEMDRERRSEREESTERPSLKRKEHWGDEKNEKRMRVLDEEEKKEAAKYVEVSVIEKDETREERRNKGEKRKFQDLTKEDMEDGAISASETTAVKEPLGDNFPVKGSHLANGVETQSMTSTGMPNDMPESSTGFNPPSTSKVSPISTTHENMGVSITRSHEVPGKSSTDGTTSAAGKSGSLSLDALAKAKKALQIQKELSEKLKKLPQLNKTSSLSAVTGPQTGLGKGTANVTTSSVSTHASSVSTNSTQAAHGQSSASTSTLPVTDHTSLKPMGSGADAPNLLGLPNVANMEAVRRAQELAAKMGFRQDPEFGPLLNLFPGQISVNITAQQKPAKAPVLRLDAQGREIDEHGNVINLPKLTNLSTLKKGGKVGRLQNNLSHCFLCLNFPDLPLPVYDHQVNINKQKKEAFQIIRPDLDADAMSNPFYDERMGINKTKLLRPKRMSFQFVEEGKWSKQAEIIKFKSQFGEAQAKELKTKQAQLARAKAELDINPNLIEVSERIPVKEEKPKEPIPEAEDLPLLRSGTFTNNDDDDDIKIKREKITNYIEHPRPIEPPAEPAPPPPQPLKLTKKEHKKLRTQRRLAKEKDRQEMIRQGLIEPPKPKVKMSNLMKVLGTEATQDPTRLEKEIRAAAAEREQAHVDRNIARKLTPAERREKKEKKLFDENMLETIVSVYKINDLSHPQTRFKVDVNAQENRLTGCAVLTEGMNVVVVEGGAKPIKRYGKLMLRRINWASAVVNEDENEENENTLINKCVLVWQGSVAKSSFNRFIVHQCRTEAAARKVFSDAGVAHYWDLAMNFSDEQI
ncbi:U4/U6 small nuclear ribonucleoprotein [Nymphaea thermarum]|nr:U4/U6 small nuclear ribonucleoprotein [Nymphaea thermarum]